MIRGSIAVLLFVAALAVSVAGVVSFWKGIPDNTLWISDLIEKPTVQFAVVRGTIHAVYSIPSASTASTKKESSLGGFSMRTVTVGNTLARGVGFPFWAAVPLLLVYPAIAFLGGPLRRRHRRREGLCLKCGYDLTGLTEPRCPECATPFTPTAGLECTGSAAAARATSAVEHSSQA
jgi:hypothetical protein